MEGDYYRCNSKQTFAAFVNFANELYDKNKYVTFKWRLGKDRSIDQNSLFHLWATEYAAHLLNKHKRNVTKGELNGMKRHLKKEFHKEFKYGWLIELVVNPKTGESKKDYTSSADYKVLEMFEFMCWIQAAGANDGVILESQGEYAKREREASGL